MRQSPGEGRGCPPFSSLTRRLGHWPAKPAMKEVLGWLPALPHFPVYPYRNLNRTMLPKLTLRIST